MTIVVRSDPRSGQASRLAAFYAASFLVVGIQLPFWPVWLNSRGLDAREIALVFAALDRHRADRSRHVDVGHLADAVRRILYR